MTARFSAFETFIMHVNAFGKPYPVTITVNDAFHLVKRIGSHTLEPVMYAGVPLHNIYRVVEKKDETSR